MDVLHISFIVLVVFTVPEQRYEFSRIVRIDAVALGGDGKLEADPLDRIEPAISANALRQGGERPGGKDRGVLFGVFPVRRAWAALHSAAVMAGWSRTSS